MSKVIVFGGKGFLGSHVVDELRARGHEVSTFDLADGQDITDNYKVHQAMDGAEVVYNFAGIADIGHSKDFPVETFRANVVGNLNILRNAPKLLRYIFASTVYVFSKKGSYYGISKQAAERCVEEFGIPYTILRYGTVYGPRSDEKNRIFRLIAEAITKKQINFDGSGLEEREFIHVKDAARLSVDALDEKYENKHVMLTGNERFSYTSIVDMLAEMMGFDDITFNCSKTDHYELTPYSYQPDQSLKLMANPYIDLGQGLLETIKDIDDRLRSKS